LQNAVVVFYYNFYTVVPIPTYLISNWWRSNCTAARDCYRALYHGVHGVILKWFRWLRCLFYYWRCFFSSLRRPTETPSYDITYTTLPRMYNRLGRYRRIVLLYIIYTFWRQGILALKVVLQWRGTWFKFKIVLLYVPTSCNSRMRNCGIYRS